MGGIKVVLAGPPRSGKSCLREGLKQAIRAIPGAPYPYVVTACPDGEGSWFQETVNLNPELARACKEAYKAKFTPAFVARVSESVARVALPLTLVDIGGIPSAENRVICRKATHAVLLAGDLGRLPEWREFCQDLGMAIVAEIHSDYGGAEDVVSGFGPDGVLRGSVHHLERGELVSSRPMVVALAELLVRLASGEEK